MGQAPARVVGRSFSSDIVAHPAFWHPDRSGRFFPPLANVSAGRAVEGSVSRSAPATLRIMICPLPSYNHPFLAMPKPEAFSRVLIDQELRESGWDLLDERRVRFELDGHSWRADYLLSGERGPLCALEAKRPDLDPYDSKEQARGYAEKLRAPNGIWHFAC